MTQLHCNTYTHILLMISSVHKQADQMDTLAHRWLDMVLQDEVLMENIQIRITFSEEIHDDYSKTYFPIVHNFSHYFSSHKFASRYRMLIQMDIVEREDLARNIELHLDNHHQWLAENIHLVVDLYTVRLHFRSQSDA